MGQSRTIANSLGCMQFNTSSCLTATLFIYKQCQRIFPYDHSYKVNTNNCMLLIPLFILMIHPRERGRYGVHIGHNNLLHPEKKPWGITKLNLVDIGSKLWELNSKMLKKGTFWAFFCPFHVWWRHFRFWKYDCYITHRFSITRPNWVDIGGKPLELDSKMSKMGQFCAVLEPFPFDDVTSGPVTWPLHAATIKVSPNQIWWTSFRNCRS